MASKELLDELQQKIGYKFNNESFLLQAMTHRSFLNETPNYEYGHNERMEFLGGRIDCECDDSAWDRGVDRSKLDGGWGHS